MTSRVTKKVGKKAAKKVAKNATKKKTAPKPLNPGANLVGGTTKIADIPEPTFRWMNKSRQWGTRVRPGKKGLTLESLNVGIYGEIPMHWQDQTRNPRGAIPRRGMPPVGYSIRDKVELWADSAGEMYEEAIQRRWAPATDVPWRSIEPLPDDVEQAICQICTELTTYANVDIESITQWQHQMAYGYHEVKQYLATASFDAARHYEVFRKRALINGGGLGLESAGQVNRMILESRGGWTEAVAYLWLLRGTFTMTMLRYLERYAYNDAERFIYAHVLQDKARHMTYALDHLKFSCAHVDDEQQILSTLLFIGDRILSRDLRDPVLREALAIVFGGGIKGARTHGMETYNQMMRDFMKTHLNYCEWLGVARRVEAMPPNVNEFAPQLEGAV